VGLNASEGLVTEILRANQLLALHGIRLNGSRLMSQPSLDWEFPLSLDELCQIFRRSSVTCQS
jgi:hypothetical protein